MTVSDLSDDALPPGQVLTRRFPVVGERSPSPEALDVAGWRLTVRGLVAEPLTLTLAEVLALPQSERVVDIHCVTGWSKRTVRLEGTPLSVLLEVAGVRESARFAHFVAYSTRDHDTSLPLDLALADTWLVHTIDGEPLTPSHGGPIRTVTPSRYFYKSLKWVRSVTLLAEDKLGYWERESAYHNDADPWPGDQRYSSGSIEPARLMRLKAAADFARWRGPKRVVLGADLRGWDPATRELGALQLKNCDLREAQLADCDLRAANLTRSDLRGADLRRVNLRGAALEGADFAGADLRGADLRETALSAARFFSPAQEAQVEGLLLEGAVGLLEAQEAWLEQRLDEVL